PPQRPDDDLASRESLGDVVGRFALELESHARQRERSEALARAAAEPEANRAGREPDVADAVGDAPGDARPHRQMVVPDVVHAGKRAPLVQAGAERLEDLLVQRLHTRAIVARHGPMPRGDATRPRSAAVPNP